MKILRMVTCLFPMVLFSLMLQTGCIGTTTFRSLPFRKFTAIAKPNLLADTGNTPTSASAEDRLTCDIARLQRISAELENLAAHMNHMNNTMGKLRRGYFMADEHDQIENLLYRYLVCRDSLWETVAYYMDYRTRFNLPQHQTKGFVLGYNAALKLSYYSSLVVATFIDVPEVVAKLNEPFYRSRIPKGTYDQLLAMVTSMDHIAALEAAWILYSQEVSDPGSRLIELADSDSTFCRLIEQMDGLYKDSRKRTVQILEHESPLMPQTTSWLRHSAIADLVQKSSDTFEDNLYAIQGLLYKTVGDFKTSKTKLIQLTPQLASKIKSMLQPCDIILTYSSGYMSNAFLPGQFKHGILYVGPPSQRKAAGLGSDVIAARVEVGKDRLLHNLQKAQLATGQDLDVIEAVAQGVIPNSLEHLMQTHVTRMVVLRPKLNAAEKIQALSTAFQLLGSQYDFNFDFNNASYQCCTEVLYRVLHAKGGIYFNLTQRMGKQTLSADDIIEYHLTSPVQSFQFVLLAEQIPGVRNLKARLLTGHKGRKRLQEIMGVKVKPSHQHAHRTSPCNDSKCPS